MSSYTNGQVGAYGAHQRGGETTRETDAHALLRCASLLENVRRADCSYLEYVEAVRHNQRLWTVFQVCLTEPDNQLPREVKLSLLQLSHYVDKVSFQCIAKKTPDALVSLININRQIAAGLNMRNEEIEKSASQPQTATISPPMPSTPPTTGYTAQQTGYGQRTGGYGNSAAPKPSTATDEKTTTFITSA